jgi:hypothetical protein
LWAAQRSCRLERLRKAGKDLFYRCAKQRSEPSSDKRGPRADELTLTPLELIGRIAALVMARSSDSDSLREGLRPRQTEKPICAQ